MPQPAQLAKLNFQGVDPTFQQWLNQLTDTVNTHSGYNGPVQFANHLDMGGKRVINIGPPLKETDALSSGVAKKNYSASALRPQLESGGAQPMRTMRRMNDNNQREQGSSFLNDIPSTVPNASQVFPTVTPSGGGVSVSIPASLYTFADGSSTMLNARTDLLSLPAQYAINTIASVGRTVTVTTTVASGLTAGQVATIEGVAPSSFNGTVQLIGATPPYTLEYQSNLGTVTGTGGYVQTNGVWYYTVAKRSQDLILLGPYTSDSLSNRLDAGYDGYQIVAVVVLTNSGASIANSGGGGSPIVGSPTAGGFF